MKLDGICHRYNAHFKRRIQHTEKVLLPVLHQKLNQCALHSQKNAKWVIADYCFRCILFYSQRAFYNQCVLQSVHSTVGAFYSQLPTIGSFYSQYSVPWLKLYIINFENFEVHHIWANIQGDNAAFFWFLIKALPSRRKRSKDIRIWLRQITRTR